jgi:hypothetical protein
MAPIRWLTVSAAASLISLTTYEVEALADYGVLTARSLDLAHYSISEQSVTAYLSASECAGQQAEVVAETAGRVPHREGPEIGDEAEEDYDRSKADYDDTPNDEGDDEQ